MGYLTRVVRHEDRQRSIAAVCGQRRRTASTVTAVTLLLLAVGFSAQGAERWIFDRAGVEDFSFQECRGQTITRSDLLGKPWVAGFIFTRCATTCPRVTGEMKKLQNELRDVDVRLVTFGVDPKYDTPEVLRDYAETVGADPERWYFLWGEQRAVYGLIHRSFKMPVQETLGADRLPGFEVIHSNNLMLVDAQGRVVGKYLATNDVDMVKLRRVLQGKDPLPQPPPEGTEEDEPVHIAPAPPRIIRLDEAGEAADENAEAAPAKAVPAWVRRLPMVNASLNGLATLLLVAGYVLIKQRRTEAHKQVMLTAFATSVVFLGCYVLYHSFHLTRPFSGTGAARSIYLTILWTHIVLAASVPFLAVTTIVRGLRGDWERHRRVARITYPIWLYVSVTGVIIYFMLYHWPVVPPV